MIGGQRNGEAWMALRPSARAGSSNSRFLVFTLVTLCGGGAVWSILDEYVFTIKLHLPLFGEVDTGVTRHELAEFQVAAEKYRRAGNDLLQARSAGRMSEAEFQTQNEQLLVAALSDRRVTAITGRPAKQFLRFLLRTVPFGLGS